MTDTHFESRPLAFPPAGVIARDPDVDALATRALAALAPARMTMSPPPSAPPVMPPPRAVAMRARRALSLPTPGNGPLRMTMSLDRRWS